MKEECRKIGEYEVVRLLGKGGMSEVYEVENPRLGSRHALKLFTYSDGDGDVRERFLGEGRLLAKLNHPRVVRVTDFGTTADAGRPYFVMDLVLAEDGGVKSLADVPPGSVDEDTIGRWYDDLREGLAYIHGRGVIHRDLKLQNVLIGPDGHAVLTDFGISKVFDAKGDGKRIVDTVNTIVKMREGRSLVMGSLGYMAPELEMGVAASPQSDWYALGVIVYRLLTGTWCDARTDILSVLETYDPVWRTIIPKLLHSNPNGRECLSYAEEKRAESERAECEAEERWLREKARGHFARHVARWLAVGLVLLVGVLAYLQLRHMMERALWGMKLQEVESRKSDGRPLPYAFDELFRIPAEAKAFAQYDDNGGLLVPARDEVASARLDLLILTHEILDALNSGKMPLEKAIEDLERLQGNFAEDADVDMDLWPSSYMQSGDDATTFWLLERALERLRNDSFE